MTGAVAERVGLAPLMGAGVRATVAGRALWCAGKLDAEGQQLLARRLVFAAPDATAPARRQLAGRVLRPAGHFGAGGWRRFILSQPVHSPDLQGRSQCGHW